MLSDKYSQEFLNAIEAQFGFLFELFGFVVKVSTEARQGEYRLVVLQSDQCLIKFRLERGTPEYFFGTAEAASDWASEKDWYNGDAICAYLFRRSPQLTVPWPKDDRKWNTDDILHVFAARLKPVVDEIIAAFASGLTVDWWNEFLSDRENRIRKMKDRIASGKKVQL